MTLNTAQYLNVLEDHLINFMDLHNFSTGLSAVSQGKSAMKLLVNNSVSALQWPGNSPDLHGNPIENLWKIVKKKVSAANPTSIDELKTIIKTTWCTNIDVKMCENLVNSMPRQIANVIANHNKY